MLNGELNNIHNVALFYNLATRYDREHVVPQLYGFFFQKFAFKSQKYTKKIFFLEKGSKCFKNVIGNWRKKIQIFVEDILPLI